MRNVIVIPNVTGVDYSLRIRKVKPKMLRKNNIHAADDLSRFGLVNLGMNDGLTTSQSE